jgi:hypothetical protein
MLTNLMFSVAFWGKKCFNICLRPKDCDWHWKTGERKKFGRKIRYLLAVIRNEEKIRQRIGKFGDPLRRFSKLSF